ncbi:MAG: hypothetical protein ACI8ZN_001780 [Bacteroidia bacterium]|jgi:hypothetical protein
MLWLSLYFGWKGNPSWCWGIKMNTQLRKILQIKKAISLKWPFTNTILCWKKLMLQPLDLRKRTIGCFLLS